jgi:hypothetical protein
VQHVSNICGRPLPEIEAISIQSGLVVLNESVVVTAEDLFSCLDRNAYRDWPNSPTSADLLG